MQKPCDVPVSGSLLRETLLAHGERVFSLKTSITGATAFYVQMWVFLKIGFL